MLYIIKKLVLSKSAARTDIVSRKLTQSVTSFKQSILKDDNSKAKYPHGPYSATSEKNLCSENCS